MVFLPNHPTRYALQTVHQIRYGHFGWIVHQQVHMMVRGVSGRYRIFRHLWRMCFATWFAASSLFIGQAQVFPEVLQDSYVLFLPSILIIILTIVWLVRTLRGKAYQQFHRALVQAPQPGANA
jgi:hypothetical protein